MTTRAIHAFDTLVYEKKLKATGFTEQQAEAQASALSDVVNDNLATKHDLKRLEERLDAKFGHKLEVLEHKLIIRLTSINVAVIGLFSLHFAA